MLACDRACVCKYTLATEFDIVKSMTILLPHGGYFVFMHRGITLLLPVYFLYQCEHPTLLALAATPSYILAA